MRTLNTIVLVVIVVMVIFVLPAAACHADATKTGPSEVCTGSEMTYTITATTRDANNLYVKVIDYLPIGVTYIASSPMGTYNPSDNTVTWIYGPVAKNIPKTMTVAVKSPSIMSAPLVNGVKT